MPTHLLENPEISIPETNALHGLRALAVLFVFIDHGATRDQFISAYWNFIGCGKVGVYFFFVLSAYLLTRQLLYGQGVFLYFAKRALRIIPIYYVCLLGVAILQYYNDGPMFEVVYVEGGWEGFKQHLLFLKGDFLLWTMPVEVKFYFVLPLVIWLLNKSPKLALLFLVPLTVVAAYYNYVNHVWGTPNQLVELLPQLIGTNSFAEVFLVGVILAFAVHKKYYSRWQATSKVGGVVGLIFVVAVIVLLVGRDMPIRSFGGEYAMYASLGWALVCAFIIVLIENGNKGIITILSCKWLVKIGKSGFGWYLGHFFIFALTNYFIIFNSLYSHPFKLAVSAFVCYHMFWLTYQYIERPFIKLV